MRSIHESGFILAALALAAAASAQRPNGPKGDSIAASYALRLRAADSAYVLAHPAPELQMVSFISAAMSGKPSDLPFPLDSLWKLANSAKAAVEAQINTFDATDAPPGFDRVHTEMLVTLRGSLAALDSVRRAASGCQAESHIPHPSVLTHVRMCANPFAGSVNALDGFYKDYANTRARLATRLAAAGVVVDSLAAVRP